MTAETEDRRRRARRQRLVLQLLPAVEGRLAEGERYPQISVERLISAVEVSRTTFYRYFADKAELLAELSRSAIEEVVAAADALWALGDDAGYEDVLEAIENIIRVYLPHTQLLSAVNDLAAYDSSVDRQYVEGFAAAQKAAADAIARGQKRGTVRPSLDPASTAGWLTWMAERGMSQLVAGADPHGRRQLTETLASIVWFTLYEGYR